MNLQPSNLQPGTDSPGTTEELLLPMLAQGASGQPFAVGQDFFLACSPERIDPGRADDTVANTPKVVGGGSRRPAWRWRRRSTARRPILRQASTGLTQRLRAGRCR